MAAAAAAAAAANHPLEATWEKLRSVTDSIYRFFQAFP